MLFYNVGGRQGSFGGRRCGYTTHVQKTKTSGTMSIVRVIVTRCQTTSIHKGSRLLIPEPSYGIQSQRLKNTKTTITMGPLINVSFSVTRRLKQPCTVHIESIRIQKLRYFNIFVLF